MTHVKYKRHTKHVDRVSIILKNEEIHEGENGLIISIPGVEFTKSFPSFITFFFQFFRFYQNNGYLLNITFIFDRCHRRLAAVTPVKCECDLKNLTSTFAKSKFSLTEKWTNGTLVTTHPWTRRSPSCGSHFDHEPLASCVYENYVQINHCWF